MFEYHIAGIANKRGTRHRQQGQGVLESQCAATIERGNTVICNDSGNRIRELCLQVVVNSSLLQGLHERLYIDFWGTTGFTEDRRVGKT
jgi:hypothetical protein